MCLPLRVRLIGSGSSVLSFEGFWVLVHSIELPDTVGEVVPVQFLEKVHTSRSLGLGIQILGQGLRYTEL